MEFFHYKAFDDALRLVREDPNYFRPTDQSIKFFEYDAFKEATRQVQEKSRLLQESFALDRRQKLGL